VGKESRRKIKGMGREEDQRGAFEALFAEAPEVPHVVPSPDPARELVQKINAVPAIALTVSEVCEMFNISRSTLYRANLPGKVVIGGSVRYDKQQLFAWWVDQQKKG